MRARWGSGCAIVPVVGSALSSVGVSTECLYGLPLYPLGDGYPGGARPRCQGRLRDARGGRTFRRRGRRHRHLDNEGCRGAVPPAGRRARTLWGGLQPRGEHLVESSQLQRAH